MTVLAMDKTGTLTEGRMAVDRLWTADGGAEAARALLEYAALCSDACMTDDVIPQRSDDPTEVALVRRALACRHRCCRTAPGHAADRRVPVQRPDGHDEHHPSNGRTVRCCASARVSPEALLDPPNWPAPSDDP